METSFDRLTGTIQGITERIEKNRMRELGAEFISSGAFSMEGVRSFMVEKDLDAGQMVALLLVIALFNRYKMAKAILN